jgi:hypothetical protein
VIFEEKIKDGYLCLLDHDHLHEHGLVENLYRS